MGQGVLGWTDRRGAWLAVALVVALVLLVNPVGYSGGGRDDTRYVEAALCWAHSGQVCLPHDHWTTRWAAIAPLASSIFFGGLSRVAVGLGTLPAYLVAVILVGWIGDLWFSRRAGIIAAAIFACVPAISIHALRPNVDMVELDAQLAALAIATIAIRSHSTRLAVAAGALAGLAVAARETSFLFAGMGAVAWFLFAPAERRLIIWAVVGFGAVIGAEMFVYLVATGDPLYRFKLALSHGSVPSTELASWVDTSHSPILNPEFVAGWKRPLGIEIWWPIDAWLNLFANPQIGPWLLTAPLAVFAARSSMKQHERQLLIRMGLGGLLIAFAIVYVLAIDPKTRAFLLPLAAATIGLGWAISTLLDAGRRAFALALLGSLMFLGFFALARYQQTMPIEQAAATLMRSYPEMIEFDAQSKRTLMLAPGVIDAPIAPAGRPLRLTIKNEACRTALAASLTTGRISLEKEIVFDDHSFLCLMRYR